MLALVLYVKRESEMIRFLSIVVIIPIISFLLLSSAFAQKEANVWYFGEYAGIDFNSGSPVPLMNGSLGTTEGCSSISDSSGNVLFYTDGGQVWNQNHIQMPDGFGLLGSFSSTQSALIVPKPNSDSLYYIFTVDDWYFLPAHDGLRYSIVDMSLQSGLGDMSIKNVLIDSPMTERITAVRHCNDVDVWVLSHEWGSDAFFAYLVTDAGISSPVISNVGSPHNNGSDFAGCLKVSPDGSKLAVALFSSKKFELFDFDNSTGVVSNPTSAYSSNYSGAYGVEFSQDGTKLYGATISGNIFQFDLLAGSSNDIINSAWIVGTSDTAIYALQLGPDGKIYVARNYGFYLGVIEYPNILGTPCNYIDTAVFLAGFICRGGLPNFVQSYFYKPSFSFAYNNTCTGDSTGFAISNTNTIDSVIWNFDDSISGSANSSTMLSPSHIFSSAGSHNVKLLIYYNCRIDTVLESVIINSLPLVSTDNDTILCIGDSAILIGTGGINYYWNTGDTTSSIIVSPAVTTIYSLSVSDSFCSAMDSITVFIDSLPSVNIIGDASICIGDSTALTVSGGISYLWNTSDTAASIIVSPSGTVTYLVSVFDSTCSTTDSIIVTVNPLPVVNLGIDTQICQGYIHMLDAGNPGSTYLWQDGSIDQLNAATISGTYYVNLTDANGCKGNDTIEITVTLLPPVYAGEDNTITLGSSVQLSGSGGLSYSWSPSNGLSCTDCQNPVANPTETTIYSVTAIDSSFCLNTDDVTIYVDKSCVIFLPNIFSPNGDGENDVLQVMGKGFEIYTFIIYDRWGEKVFETNDVGRGWDGTYKGVMMNPAVFVYYLETTCTYTGEKFATKGDITLVR